MILISCTTSSVQWLHNILNMRRPNAQTLNTCYRNPAFGANYHCKSTKNIFSNLRWRAKQSRVSQWSMFSNPGPIKNWPLFSRALVIRISCYDLPLFSKNLRLRFSYLQLLREWLATFLGGIFVCVCVCAFKSKAVDNSLNWLHQPQTQGRGKHFQESKGSYYPRSKLQVGFFPCALECHGYAVVEPNRGNMCRR